MHLDAFQFGSLSQVTIAGDKRAPFLLGKCKGSKIKAARVAKTTGQLDTSLDSGLSEFEQEEATCEEMFVVRAELVFEEYVGNANMLGKCKELPKQTTLLEVYEDVRVTDQHRH